MDILTDIWNKSLGCSGVLKQRMLRNIKKNFINIVGINYREIPNAQIKEIM
jgi:hypothetical protein